MKCKTDGLEVEPMSSESLLVDLMRIVRDKDVKRAVEGRILEFLRAQTRGDVKWFEELAFCILTANSKALTGLKAVESLKVERLLLKGDAKEIEAVLERVGHRFAKKRAEYIVLAGRLLPGFRQRLLSIPSIDGKREWLVKNVKGIGMKEASHFLRNMGFLDVAIIDRHILRALVRYGLVDDLQTSLTKRRYLEIEELLKDVARRIDLEVGVLDLYLWYMETGSVLK